MVPQVVIKFFPDHRHYSHEKLFYENRMALESETAAEYVPTMFESLSAQKEAWMGAGDNLPPSIVLERGQCTLQVCVGAWQLSVPGWCRGYL